MCTSAVSGAISMRCGWHLGSNWSGNNQCCNDLALCSTVVDRHHLHACVRRSNCCKVSGKSTLLHCAQEPSMLSWSRYCLATPFHSCLHLPLFVDCPMSLPIWFVAVQVAQQTVTRLQQDIDMLNTSLQTWRAQAKQHEARHIRSHA